MEEVLELCNKQIRQDIKGNHPGRTVWLGMQHQGFEEAQINLGRNHFQSMARFEVEPSTGVSIKKICFAQKTISPI